MDNTTARLYSTDLKDRTLWFDGQSSFDPKRLNEMVHKYDIKWVDYITPNVVGYNRNVQQKDEIRVKETCDPLTYNWTIPDQYKTLSVVDYLIDRHYEMCVESIERGEMTHDEIEEREARLASELHMFKSRKLFDVLRTIIYIVNTLTAKNIVWGVGRGSSVSSYVLYVIGVHDVDSFAYDLDVNDFLHE